MVQIDYSFSLDGYAIIRKEPIDRIRHGEYERTRRKILNKEGILDSDYGIRFNIDLSDFSTVFRDLKDNEHHVGIQCGYRFLIGPIRKVNKKSVSIQNYDPNGLLDEETSLINYNEINDVTFGDRYTTIFKKYLRTKK